MSYGLHISSLHLKDAVVFKDAKFDIEPGVSVIYGLNRTNATRSGNGNGSGKSAMFSQIGEILFEDPIIGERQDAVKTGQRTLSTIIRGKQVDIDRNGNKLDILINGKSKQFRTKPLARQWLQDNLPIDQMAYDSYVHLDSRRPHPLVMGSSTERKKFFTEFFGLDKIDIERKLFTAELAKLAKVRAGYSEVVSEYKTVKAKQVPKEQVAELKQEIEALETTLSDLNEKNVRLQSIAQLLNFETSALPQLEQLRNILPTVDTESFDQLMADTKWSYKTDTKDLEDAKLWQQYQRDYQHYDKALQALPADAKKLIAKLGIVEARKKCVNASRRLTDLNSQLRQSTRDLNTVEAQLGEPLPDKVVATGDKKELRAKLDSLEHQYDHAKQFKTGTCETCGQSVKTVDVNVLKTRISKIKADLEALSLAAEYSEAVAYQKELKASLKQHKDKVAELEPQIAQLKRYADLADSLVEVPSEPAKFSGKKLEVTVKQRMVDEDKERLQLLQFLRPNLDTIIELQALTDRQRNSGTLASKLQQRINECHEKLSKLRARLEVNAMVTSDVKRLSTRLMEMRALLTNEEPLKLLVEAYSDKSMKRMAVQAISSRLMTEINKYSKHVFSEDYFFEFVWDTSQLSLLAHRKYGKKVLTSDVRKLSGAESKLFTLVMVLALLTFVPMRKRANVLVLDEPSANFSHETTAAFMKLIPVMNKVIPSIIIITPKSDERYENAKEFTVVKTKGVSSIVAGHPSEVRK